MRCMAVAPAQSGMLTFCPKMEVVRSITDTSLSTRGYSFHLAQTKRIKSRQHHGYLQFLTARRRFSCCEEKHGESCVGAGAELHCMTQSCSGTLQTHKARREQARKEQNPWRAEEAKSLWTLLAGIRWTKDRSWKIIMSVVSPSLLESIGAELDDRGCENRRSRQPPSVIPSMD